MVGVKGLEPSTSASQTRRASQLRHTPEALFPPAQQWPEDELTEMDYTLESNGLPVFLLDRINTFMPASCKYCLHEETKYRNSGKYRLQKQGELLYNAAFPVM